MSSTLATSPEKPRAISTGCGEAAGAPGRGHTAPCCQHTRTSGVNTSTRPAARRVRTPARTHWPVPPAPHAHSLPLSCTPTAPAFLWYFGTLPFFTQYETQYVVQGSTIVLGRPYGEKFRQFFIPIFLNVSYFCFFALAATPDLPRQTVELGTPSRRHTGRTEGAAPWSEGGKRARRQRGARRSAPPIARCRRPRHRSRQPRRPRASSGLQATPTSGPVASACGLA